MLPAAALAFQLLLLAPEGTPAFESGGEPQAAAQTTAPSQTPQPAPAAPPQLPINFNKIKIAVQNPPALTLVDKSPFRFYSETVRPAPKFKDMVGDFDLFRGPVPHAGMTHSEFVQSTRPKDMYSSAGFTPGDIIRWGILGYTEGKAFELIRLGLKKLNEVKTEAERKQIRAQIERELAALRGEIIK